jgi:hypothetical protein
MARESEFYIKKEDGTPVKVSVEKYLKHYRDLARPICKATGATLHSFDPSIQFRFKGKVFDLNIDFIKSINKNLK